MAMVTPTPGDVYRTPDGLPSLYVRTEAGEWVFIVVRERAIYERRIVAGPELPPQFEPVDDRTGRADARAAFAELERVERERDAFQAALRYCVPLLPAATAKETRRIHREALV